MNRRVIRIDEHQHFADYAELQKPQPQELPSGDRIDFFWLGVWVLVGCSVYAFLYVAFVEWR